MASLVSKEEIANMALDYIKEAPLASFDEGTKRADWFLRNYEQFRRSTLISPLIPWGFATKYWNIPQAPDAPDGPWSYQYKRPADLLRMEPLRIDGNREGSRVPFEIVGNYILTDYNANPLIIKGRANITNAGEFTAQFVDVLALRMAVKLAHFITGKNSLRQELRDSLADVLDVARTIENQENPYRNPTQDRNLTQSVRRFTARGARRAS